MKFEIKKTLELDIETMAEEVWNSTLDLWSDEIYGMLQDEIGWSFDDIPKEDYEKLEEMIVTSVIKKLNESHKR